MIIILNIVQVIFFCIFLLLKLMSKYLLLPWCLILAILLANVYLAVSHLNVVLWFNCDKWRFSKLSVWSEEPALPIQSLHHGKRWNMLFNYNNNDDLKFQLWIEYPSCLYCLLFAKCIRISWRKYIFWTSLKRKKRKAYTSQIGQLCYSSCYFKMFNCFLPVIQEKNTNDQSFFGCFCTSFFIKSILIASLVPWRHLEMILCLFL